MINLNNFNAHFTLNKGVDLIETVNQAMAVNTYKYKDMAEQFNKMLDKYKIILVDCCYGDMIKKINKINKLGFNIIETEICGTGLADTVRIIITKY